MTIPQTQTVAWLDTPKPGATLDIRHDIPVPTPGAGEVLIKMEYSGFCHSDVHNIHGQTPMTTNIPGHEGVGRVIQAGPGAPEDIIGKRAGVKWIYSACKKCPICKIRYTNCPNQRNSGKDVPGTFQQYVVSPADFVTIIPESVKPEAAAPLLCAGITMFSAIKKLDNVCKKGDWVAIVGAGGGLGHLGIQIGKEMGYRIIAVDSASKKDICMNSGASAFVDFAEEDAAKQVKSLTDSLGAHAVIVVVGVEAGYNLGVKFLRPFGTLVCVGIPRMSYHIPLSPIHFIGLGYNVIGSAVGTEEEMQELLQMAAEGRVSTHYEVFEFDKVNEVMERLVRYEIKGRVVLRIP